MIYLLETCSMSHLFVFKGWTYVCCTIELSDCDISLNSETTKSDQAQSRLEVLLPTSTCYQNQPEVEDFVRIRMFCYDFAESHLFMKDPFEHILEHPVLNIGSVDSASRVRLLRSLKFNTENTLLLSVEQPKTRSSSQNGLPN